MMIGPEPRMRILERSVRLGIYFSNSVIPTKSDDSLSESSGAWRDLLFRYVLAPQGPLARDIFPGRSALIDQPINPCSVSVILLFSTIYCFRAILLRLLMDEAAPVTPCS